MQADIGISGHLFLNGLVACTRACHNHIQPDIGTLQLLKSTDRTAGQIFSIGASKKDEYSTHRTFGLSLRMKLRINRLKQRVFRTQQHGAFRGRPIDITLLQVQEEVLIQQDVAIMQAICQIIDDHQLIDRRPKKSFPMMIQGIVVHNQPLRSGTCPLDGKARQFRVFNHRRPQPGSMRHLRY